MEFRGSWSGPTQGRVIVIVFPDRADDVIRMVSARKAMAREVELFRKHAGRQA